MSAYTRHSVRIGVAITLTIMLIAFQSGKAIGYFGYSCSTHCYAVNAWSISTGEYFGASTNISVGQLTCDVITCVPSSGFISDEMWLIDATSCTNQADGLCWVETGYIDYQSTAQTYFWADERPGQNFTFELFQNVPVSQYGNTNQFVIINDVRTTPAGFQVLVYNGSTILLQGTSNDNAMVPTQIMIGQELFGSGGASAPTVTFTHNMFAVQALGPDNMFVYNTQMAEGTVTSNIPPTGQWDNNPATSSDGGQFSTSCC